MKRIVCAGLCAAALTLQATEVKDLTSTLQNPDFESCSYSSWVTDCPGWTLDWNTIGNPWPAKYSGSWEAFAGGNYYLNLYGSSATAGVVAKQQVTAPETGRYTLSVNAMVDASTSCFSLYLANGTTVVTKPITIDGDVTYSVSVDAVEGDVLTLGISTTAATSAVWGYADNFRLYVRPSAGVSVVDSCVTLDGHTYRLSDGYATLLTDDTDTYLRGADISELSYVESLGAKFYDAEGRESDALDVMRANGINTVRLRLYNCPGNSVTYGGQTYALPAGFLDEADVLSLARRAKSRGMQIELTFHYSDFWTNGEMQFKPKAWEECTLAALKDSVYTYTKTVLQHMVDQGTAPDFVSLGNEIQAGMLFGYFTDVKSLPAVNGYCNDMTNLRNLLARGSAAVREVCPEAKVIIHLTMSTGVTASTFSWFFSKIKALDYDLIGASYYPYWTDATPSGTLDPLITALDKAGISKDIVLMETGYAWMRYKPYGRYKGQYEGQLHLNGSAYGEASREGQKAFMHELQTYIKAHTRIKGYYYWDPVMVEQQVGGSWIPTGWVSGGENVVGNSTLFDYEGRPLPVFDAIREDYIPAEVTVSDVVYKVLRQGQTPASLGRVPSSASSASSTDKSCYSLSGIRLSQPVGGICLVGGRKVLR